MLAGDNLFSPGITMKWFRDRRERGERVRIEDALKHLLDSDESGRGATMESLAGALGRSRKGAAELLGDLRARGLAVADGDHHHLSAEGRQYALQVVRTHRLYETWLSRETAMPSRHWHRAAHRAEHALRREQVDALADRLNNPRFDPHGDPIPTREGHLPQMDFPSLASWPDGHAGVIAHIEDEPEALYRRIESLGLAAGSPIRDPRHLADGSVECSCEGKRIRIAAPLAGLIHLAELRSPEEAPPDVGRLSALAPGEFAFVHSLSPACKGAERKRLLDLGIVPGTRIACEFASPFGSPRSYQVRGALIALRDTQADRILITRSPAQES
jgi:DtxR family Mn-dependent transcriptional regulator